MSGEKRKKQHPTQKRKSNAKKSRDPTQKSDIQRKKVGSNAKKQHTTQTGKIQRKKATYNAEGARMSKIATSNAKKDIQRKKVSTQTGRIERTLGSAAPPSVRPEMCLFGVFRRQKGAFPKVRGPKMGLTQKSKVPKWVCRSPLAVVEAAPTRFRNDPTLFRNIWPR